MAFEVPGGSEFVVNNDQPFYVSGDEKFYRPREDTWLKAPFGAQNVVREGANRYVPRISADKQFTKLPPNRDLERLHAAW